MNCAKQIRNLGIFAALGTLHFPLRYYRDRKIQIQGKHLQRADCAPMFPLYYVGNDLSSRLVSKQVFSAQQSLTSVFGMGTGGPSALKSPTAAPYRHGLYVSALTYLPGSSPSKYFRHCRA